MKTEETFKPISHKPPIGFINSLLFKTKLIIDFQVLTVYRSFKKYLKGTNGNLLDLGCGESPYRFLINERSTNYYGLDINDSIKFSYQREDIILFDGNNIPFPDNFFDNIICTEVLEHVENYQALIDEVHRVLKKR